MPKKIYIFTEYYYPEISAATGYYMTGIAETLAREHDVTVICASQNTDESGKRIRKEEHNGVNIIRLKSPDLDKNKLIQRTIKFIILGIKFFFSMVWHVRKGDHMLAVTNPAPIVIFASWIRRMRSIHLSLLVHDVFPENLVAAGLASPRSLMYRCFRWWFKRAYKRADKLIAIGDDMAEVLKDKLKADDDRFALITNWADTDEVRPSGRNDSDLIKEHSLEDKLVIQFAGTIGRAQGIQNIVAAMSEIKDPDIHFLFLGAGACTPLITEGIEQGTLKNATYAGSFPRSQQNTFLSACDIALVSLAQGMFGLGVPCKSYNIMASARPILLIADPRSEIAKVIKEHNIGWVVPPGDPEALKKTIQEISRNRDQIKEMGKQARHIAETLFARNIILQKYLDLYSSL